MFVLLLYKKEPSWQDQEQGEVVMDTTLPETTPWKASILIFSLGKPALMLMPRYPFNLLSLPCFSHRGKTDEKEMGTMTFLLFSTFPLLFSLKCQLLLYKREDHKCGGMGSFIKVEEMTRQIKSISCVNYLNAVEGGDYFQS